MHGEEGLHQRHRDLVGFEAHYRAVAADDLVADIVADRRRGRGHGAHCAGALCRGGLYGLHGIPSVWFALACDRTQTAAHGGAAATKRCEGLAARQPDARAVTGRTGAATPPAADAARVIARHYIWGAAPLQATTASVWSGLPRCCRRAECASRAPSQTRVGRQAASLVDACVAGRLRSRENGRSSSPGRVDSATCRRGHARARPRARQAAFEPRPVEARPWVGLASGCDVLVAHDLVQRVAPAQRLQQAQQRCILGWRKGVARQAFQLDTDRPVVAPVLPRQREAPACQARWSQDTN